VQGIYIQKLHKIIGFWVSHTNLALRGKITWHGVVIAIHQISPPLVQSLGVTCYPCIVKNFQISHVATVS